MNKFFYSIVCLFGLLLSPLVITVIALYHVREEVPEFYEHLFKGLFFMDDEL